MTTILVHTGEYEQCTVVFVYTSCTVYHYFMVYLSLFFHYFYLFICVVSVLCLVLYGSGQGFEAQWVIYACYYIWKQMIKTTVFFHQVQMTKATLLLSPPPTC